MAQCKSPERQALRPRTQRSLEHFSIGIGLIPTGGRRTPIVVAVAAGGDARVLQKEDDMNDLRRAWWNPIGWLEAIWSLFASIIGSILRLFGIEMPMHRMQHENITEEDVDHAYHDATAAEKIDDCLPEIDRRVHGFVRYVQSSPEERAAFDLSVFDERLQDFCLGLSEEDIEVLRRRGAVGQLQAALVGRIPPDVEMKTAPDATTEPSKAYVVRQRFLAAVRGLPEEDTKFEPVDCAPAPGR